MLKKNFLRIGFLNLFLVFLLRHEPAALAAEDINTQSMVPGQNYVSFCRDNPSAPVIMAYTAGYTSGAGVIVMLNDKKPMPWCIPDEIRLPRKAETVCNFLTAHPTRLDEPMWSLTMEALGEAWPC